MLSQWLVLALKAIFQVAAAKEGLGIRIVNEPFKASSVFLVEAGESRTRPETMLEWLKRLPDQLLSLPLIRQSKIRTGSLLWG